MTHFGLICPAETGHLNTMLPLGRELQQRGHQVTLFGIPDAQPKTQVAGLNFWAIGESDYPLGTSAEIFTQLGELSGLAALQCTISWIQKAATMFFKEAPEAIKKSGVEALLVEQVSREGEAVAEFLNIPFITV